MFHHAMREEYLKPTPLKPYMTYADHLVWPIHVPRRCEPLITPHLSLWGNSRTRATFPTHKKSHNPRPQGERGKGVNMGTLHCGGVGGVPAKPGSYIYLDLLVRCLDKSKTDHPKWGGNGDSDSPWYKVKKTHTNPRTSTDQCMVYLPAFG